MTTWRRLGIGGCDSSSASASSPSARLPFLRSEATDVEVADLLPTDVALVSATPQRGTCDLGLRPLRCCVGDLPVGDTLTVTIVGRIGSDVGVGELLRNLAGVGWQYTDPDPSDNVAVADTTVSASGSDLVIAKTASRESVTPGRSVTYLLTVANQGAAGAHTVVVTTFRPASPPLPCAPRAAPVDSLGSW